MSGAMEKAMGVVRGIGAAIKNDLSPFNGSDSIFKSGGGLIENLNLAVKGAARSF